MCARIKQRFIRKDLFNYLKVRVLEKETDGFHLLVHCPDACTRPKPAASPRSRTWASGPKQQAIHCCLPRPLAGRQTRSSAAGTQIATFMGCQQCQKASPKKGLFKQCAVLARNVTQNIILQTELD